MATHQLTLTLDLPEDLTLEDAKGMAALFGLPFDNWVSRCIVEHTREAALALSDPERRSQFELHRSMGPINSTPKPRPADAETTAP